MSYTDLPKWADIQKAINVVKTAKGAYTTAQNATKTTYTSLNSAIAARDKAEQKLQQLQSAFDDGSYLPKNPGYASAQRTIATAEKNRDAAQTKLDAATDKNRAALEKAFNTANKAVDTAYANLEKARVAAEKAYQQGTILPAQRAYDSAYKAFDTAQNKYYAAQDKEQSALNTQYESYNQVRDYAQMIAENAGGINKKSDVALAQKLVVDFNNAVKGVGLSDFASQITPVLSNLDFTAGLPTVNIPKANPDYFSNIDQSTGLPVLDQGALDSVLDKYKSDTLNKDQYRDNYNKFGWNVKSDGSSVARGAAIFGLEKTQSYAGMGSPAGITYSGDFNKAAKQAGVDISGLKTNEEKYNAINDATKDFYVVANSLDRGGQYAGQNTKSPHAAILFRADGSGNLVPVTQPDGQLAAKYFDAVGNSVAGWRGQLAELAPIISIASMAFLPGLGQALQGSIAAALPSIGTAGSAALAGAVTNAGLAALTGGDVGQAALMGGAGALAQVKAADIANTAMRGVENVQKLADFAGLTLDQTQKIVAQGLTTGLGSAALAPDNIGENVISNIAAGFTSAKAQNFVADVLKDSDALPFAFDAAGNVARVGTEALIRGEDLTTALQAAAPSIIASGLKTQADATPSTAALPTDQVMAFGPEDVGPDYSTITGQAGAGALSGFGQGAVAPSDWSLATPLSTGTLSTGPGYNTIQSQAGAGALGSISGSTLTDTTRTLPEVEVTAKWEPQVPITRFYPTAEQDTPEYQEYIKASQEFPLTPYEPEALAGVGNIVGDGMQGPGGSGSSLGLLSTPTLSGGAVPREPTPTMLQTRMPQQAFDQLLQLKQLYPGLADVDPGLLDVITSRLPQQDYYTYGAQQQSPLDLYSQYVKDTGGTPPSAGLGFGDTERTSLITPNQFVTDANRMAGLQASEKAQPFMFRSGGDVHVPEFITGKTGHYVEGAGDGQSDSIPAMLADGEYVFDADTVAALGNGSNKAGAQVLDKMRENIRKHKRSASHKKIPPPAKSPLEYLKG